jgi:hypothetical protein
MFQRIPDDLPFETLLSDVQGSIISLLRQQANLKFEAQVARTLGDGEEQLAPIRKALERSMKALAAYRGREKMLLAEVQRKNDAIFGSASTATADSVEAA